MATQYKQSYNLTPLSGAVVTHGNGPTPTTPTAPTSLRQTATTGSTVSLAWDGVAGTYTLQRATVTNGMVGAYAAVYTGTTKSYTDGPLSYGAQYRYRVFVTVNGVASGYSVVLQFTANAAARLRIALDGDSIATQDIAPGWYDDLVVALNAWIAGKTSGQLAAAGLTAQAPEFIYQTPGGTVIPISGQTAYAMNNAAADIDGVYDSTKYCVLLTIGEPYNGTRSDQPVYTPAEAAALYNQYCQDRKATNAWRKIVGVVGFDDKAGTTLGYNQPAGGYTAVRDSILANLDAQKTAQVNFWDTLGKVDPAFDQTDPAKSADRIHPTRPGYTTGYIIQRAIAALDQAVFNNAQPAPVTSAVTPTITSFAPPSAAIGATVTVTGTGFVNITSVAVNGTVATFNTVSATQLTFVVPAGSSTGTFTITNAGGTATSPTTLTVTAAPTVPTGPFNGLLTFTRRTPALQNTGNVYTSAGGDWLAARATDTQYKRAFGTIATIWLNRQVGDEFCIAGFHTSFAATPDDITTINSVTMGLWLTDDAVYGQNINILANGTNINTGIVSLDYAWYGVRPNPGNQRVELVATNDDPLGTNPTIVVLTPAAGKGFPTSAYTGATLFPVLLIDQSDAPNGGKGRNISIAGGTPI